MKNMNRTKMPYLVFLIPYKCFRGVLWPFQRDSSGLSVRCFPLYIFRT